MSGEPQIHPGDTDEFAWHSTENWLPSVVDVAIIGGGIIGCSTAYFLARSGVSVAVFEKGRIGGEQSGRNWGWVRQQCRSPVELPLMMQSLRLWKELPAQLGEDLGFRQGGTLYLAENETELAGACRVARGRARARPRHRDHRGPRAQGCVCRRGPLDGRALHGERRARRAFTRNARDCPRREGGGRVHCEPHRRARHRIGGRARRRRRDRARPRRGARRGLRGRRLDTAILRLARHPRPAAARAQLCRAHGPAPELLVGQAWSPAIAIRRRADGGYTVAHGHTSIHSIVPASFREGLKYLPAFRSSRESTRITVGSAFFRALATPSRWPLDRESPFERERVLNPAPNARVLREMRASLERWLPELAATPFAETWGGMIDVSPDVLPIIAPVESLGDFFIATGFSGHGFGIGPGAGKLIAGMVSGSADPATLAGFRLSRFFDGSPIVPGPAI
jgi:glycine/D-amino acid oxidase-like deaminating enzyme